jgi:diguanylate cyclase (GGDEF)-like protein
MTNPGQKSNVEAEVEELTATDESGFRRAQTTLSDRDRPSIVSLPPSKKDRALLTVLNGPSRGVIVALSERAVTLGRSDESDVVIPEPSLSRVHARIHCARWPGGNQYFIEDAGSTNGTYVGRERIERSVMLNDGDRIGLGRRTFLRFGIQDRLEHEALLQVHDSALHDGLTGLSNRSVFDERLNSELAYAQRHRSAVSLIMIDVDHFKRFNDEYGHQAGDAALRHVARVMKRELRAEDLLARYGGEEFAVVLRDATPPEAQLIAERIRADIAGSPLHWGARALAVTASLGIAHYNGAIAPSPTDLIALADRALYCAKDQGRDRWVDAGALNV